MPKHEEKNNYHTSAEKKKQLTKLRVLTFLQMAVVQTVGVSVHDHTSTVGVGGALVETQDGGVVNRLGGRAKHLRTCTIRDG